MAAHFLPKLPSTTTTTRVSQSDNVTKHSQSHTFLKPQHSWLVGFRINDKRTDFSLKSSYVRPHLSQRRHFAARVLSSLPTARPDSVVSTDKGPKWSWRAIKSFAMGELEARKLKYATTGTESLLMGILVEGTSLAAKFLRANGVTLLKVRDETVKLLGKGDMYFYSPEHPPLTEAAQKAINWAIDRKLKSGNGGEVTSSDLLLGIWSEVDSPGHKILAALGFNNDKAKELESLISEPGFVDD
ncbi:ATP-dependent Clp protease ATP-binding subunit CLPT2, chloroplastic [Melia azedarach]|uniref:ATP-dependent Clp protease ATP-binding subunit CLPT2, chloroplastic n=1 Tax=Melia azedarach TaxID=155640 RepID=A0ACC1XN99_MELAZ|nr:ATP-dependent Clp protease ATP-binding subunit CLPT2, chloroplastic [Melia azedarach]